MRNLAASTAPSTGLPPASTGVCSTAPLYPLRGGTPTAAVETASGVPTGKPANDNRPLKRWPTGKRLLAAQRFDDYRMLIDYRRLLVMAWGTPANDNHRDPAPRPGAMDERPIEDQIDQTDMIDEVLPTLAELHDLSGVPWKGDAGFDESSRPRPVLVARDRGGVEKHAMGGLTFVAGSFLLEYTDAKGKLRRPMEVRRPHRAKRASPAIVPNVDWAIDDTIDARQQVRRLWQGMPASSVRILEHALGSTTAREIGEAFGKHDKVAERLGVRLVDRAIGHMRSRWPSPDCELRAYI